MENSEKLCQADCGRPVTSKRASAKFCSNKCRQAYHRRNYSEAVPDLYNAEPPEPGQDEFHASAVYSDASGVPLEVPNGGPMERAVMVDLMQLPVKMRQGAVAGAALTCARALDEGGLSPRDAAGFSREIRLAMADLRAIAPGDVRGDTTDEVRQRRENRLKGSPGNSA